VFEQIGTRFRQAVARFAEAGIPVVKFAKGARKVGQMAALFTRRCAGEPVRDSSDRLGAGIPAGVDRSQA
jgi:hypothetical protein